MRHYARSARLCVFSLKPCSTLFDVAKGYLMQVLTGLSEVHSADLVHRGRVVRSCQSLNPNFNEGLSLYTVGLSSREKSGQSKLVKIMMTGYYVKLLDLHRSNPFGPSSHPVVDSTNLPESWLGLFFVPRNMHVTDLP